MAIFIPSSLWPHPGGPIHSVLSLVCLIVRVVPEEPPHPLEQGFEREKHGYTGHLHTVYAMGTIRILSHYWIKAQALKVTCKTASQNNVMT